MDVEWKGSKTESGAKPYSELKPKGGGYLRLFGHPPLEQHSLYDQITIPDSYLSLFDVFGYLAVDTQLGIYTSLDLVFNPDFFSLVLMNSDFQHNLFSTLRRTLIWNRVKLREYLVHEFFCVARRITIEDQFLQHLRCIFPRYLRNCGNQLSHSNDERRSRMGPRWISKRFRGELGSSVGVRMHLIVLSSIIFSISHSSSSSTVNIAPSGQIGRR
jgi:hypothetical protein